MRRFQGKNFLVHPDLQRKQPHDRPSGDNSAETREASPVDTLCSEQGPVPVGPILMERVLSLDRVAPLPSGNCGASFNDDIGIGARQIQKSQSASAFICDYLVSWLADRHRRCKRAVPCVQDMLEDFKELRGAIQKKAKNAHNFQDFERMVTLSPSQRSVSHHIVTGCHTLYKPGRH